MMRWLVVESEHVRVKRWGRSRGSSRSPRDCGRLCCHRAIPPTASGASRRRLIMSTVRLMKSVVRYRSSGMIMRCSPAAKWINARLQKIRADGQCSIGYALSRLMTPRYIDRPDTVVCEERRRMPEASAQGDKQNGDAHLP